MRKAIGMENKFNLGIEISESVSKTAIPNEIKRYDIIPKKKIKVKENKTNILYRYRPGVNGFMTRDLDV